MEIANGYEEITDSEQLSARVRQENERRSANNQPTYAIDNRILTSVELLGPCSGIALGVDRLLMAMYKQVNVDQVMGFSLARV
jgi:lysyl-tRNA synthetase class 2